MRIQASQLLHVLMEGDRKIKVLEGGSRSGKTYAVLQWLILYCQNHEGEGRRITICRKRLTWLKDTVLKDFKDILKQYGIWRDKHFTKTVLEYNLYGNEVSFIGLDEPQKLHGRKQDVFWINEAIEAGADDFDQLEMRTTGEVFLDYNPSFTSHWIYDRVLMRSDVQLIHSTMLDNPFLDTAVIEKIRSFEPTAANLASGTADEVKWKVYGLGERAQPEGIIFTKVGYVAEFPKDCTKVWYGLDFGFTNHPTAIIKVGLYAGELYLQELCYSTRLTNSDIHDVLQKAAVGKALIVADSADPKSITELRSKGWNVKAAAKGPDSVRAGIDVLQRYKIFITETSLNIKQEALNYTWAKDNATGKWLNTPKDDFNHAWDAVRYVALEKLNTRMELIKPAGFGVIVNK